MKMSLTKKVDIYWLCVIYHGCYKAWTSILGSVIISFHNYSQSLERLS